MIINKKNYFSKEVRSKNMASTTFKELAWGCQARTMAKLKGEWEPEEKKVFLQGHYLHSWSEGKLDEFIEKHRDQLISSRGASKGMLKAEYREIGTVIEDLEKDKLFMAMISGEKEKFFQAEWLGMNWIVQIDIYNPEREFISDLKYIKSFDDKYYNVHRGVYEYWLEYRKYIHQLVIYRQIEMLATGRKEPLQAFIAGVTKEKPHNKAIMHFKEREFENALIDIEMMAKEVKEVFTGLKEPKSCGCCEYCREKRKIKNVEYWKEVAEGDRI